MDMEYTVLENGLDFVLMAINNLSIINDDNPNDKAKKRLMKCALLHLSSGVELIFKHKLLDEHWTYVFADMNRASKEALQSGDFRSADSETIIDRLKNLCEIDISQNEEISLKNLRKRRNKAEHFNLNESFLSIEKSMHKCISILVRIIVKYYDLEEFNDEENELFTEIKSLMRQQKQHYDDAKSIAQKELEQSGNQKYVIICPDCEEKFLLRDDVAKCIFCGYEASGEDAAKDYIENVLGISEYRTVKEGGEIPQYECPACDHESLVYDVENGKVLCFSCDFEDDISKYSFCNYCGGLFKDTEDGIGMCSSCIDYKFHEDD